MKTVLGKKTPGHGYKYTELSDINDALAEEGIYYYQYIEPIDGKDYIYTVPIINGEECSPRRGCQVVIGTLYNKSNPAQEQGSGITYARRYSLLMAFGLSTTDDDAACLDKEKKDPTGYPSRDEMISLVKKRYPKDSEPFKKLMAAFDNAESIEDLKDNQLKAVYAKIESKG